MIVSVSFAPFSKILVHTRRMKILPLYSRALIQFDTLKIEMVYFFSQNRNMTPPSRRPPNEYRWNINLNKSMEKHMFLFVTIC